VAKRTDPARAIGTHATGHGFGSTGFDQLSATDRFRSTGYGQLAMKLSVEGETGPNPASSQGRGDSTGGNFATSFPSVVMFRRVSGDSTAFSSIAPVMIDSLILVAQDQ
jgi:hypothetical protein